jgi:hypothetical protein
LKAKTGSVHESFIIPKPRKVMLVVIDAEKVWLSWTVFGELGCSPVSPGMHADAVA